MTIQKKVFISLIFLITFVFLTRAADWPTWKGDAVRSAATEAALPEDLKLVWSRELGKPIPAWPESQHKIRFDVSYEPVVAGQRVFISSMVSDSVTAFDTETGAELWRFYADAPVRFAPLVWRDLVIVGSDDGRVYALDTASGLLRWKKEAAPRKRWAIGNHRLGSLWPVRGAPVVIEEEGGGATLYVAASIWPFMGTFIYALNPATGEEIWSNSGSGSEYVLQKHTSPAFAGVAPQGYLTASGDYLLVSGGRTVPAAYNRHNGKKLYYELHTPVFGKEAGGFEVGIIGEHYYNNGCVYELTNGAGVSRISSWLMVPGYATRIGDGYVSVSDDAVVWADNKFVSYERAQVDRKGVTNYVTRYKLASRNEIGKGLPAGRAHFRAGDSLFLSGKNGWIGAIDMKGVAGSNLVWESRVEGEVWSMIPGAGKLFVSMRDGTLHAFGKSQGDDTPTIYNLPDGGVPSEESVGGPEGYAMLWGLKGLPGGYIRELARRFHVIGVDADAELVATLRRQMDDAGYYGRRVHLLCGDPLVMEFPHYMSSLLEIRLPAGRAQDIAARAWHVLRPYGGMAIYKVSDNSELKGFFAELFSRRKRRRVELEALEKFAFDALILRQAGASGRLDPGRLYARMDRAGPIPGSAPWTHENADTANSVVSRDEHVKAPLGLLWYGGPSNDDILPRHGHGPSPQICGGRVFIEGPNALRAVDAYTGRLMWQRVFPGLGTFYDNTAHQPGANEIGSNYVSVEDGVYVVYEKQCHRLDPVTGDTLAVFDLPAETGAERPNWGYVGVYKDLLVGTAEPMAVRIKEDESEVEYNAKYASSSKRIVVMDRYTGRVLWQRVANQVFRHNSVAVAAGRVFCIDGLSAPNLAAMRRRGEEPQEPARIFSLDARTGEVIWSSEEEVFGTWLSYSDEQGLILEAGSPGGDRARDEARGRMAVYRADDGALVWREKINFSGRPMLLRDTIYTQGAAFSILTGERLKRLNPITGQEIDWSYRRNYGCNTPIGGQHMLLFRSAAAGFYDLERDSGTGNWGGFKSGCTSNLMPADGILNVPDYTRTCTCSYQNQCSLALVPMPDVEIWTFQGFEKIEGPVRNLAVNFGGAGDWMSDEGTLWFEYPALGGPGPKLELEISDEVSWFRRHALDMTGAKKQVAASGLEGAARISVPLQNDEEAAYRVSLVFADPETDNAGERVFDVFVQGEPVLKNFDVVSEAGGRRRSLIHNIENVLAGEQLEIELKASDGSKYPPVLGGISIARLD